MVHPGSLVAGEGGWRFRGGPGRGGRGGLGGDGLDLRAGTGALEAVDDDALAALYALLDDDQVVHLAADLHRALLDDVLVVDDEDIAAGLVGAEGTLGDEQDRAVQLVRDAEADEGAGDDGVVFVGEDGAALDGAGLGVEGGVGIFEAALVGEPGLVAEGEVHRDRSL